MTSPLQKRRSGALLLFLLTFAAYSPALMGGFLWDDDQYVTQNPLLADGRGLVKIWTTTESPQYYPLVFTGFWLERRLWGFNPFGYHAVNVALHAANAFLLWLLLGRLKIKGAWWAGAIFALHPVHVESAAWITERKNVLSGFFFLLALKNYLEFEENQKGRSYLSACGSFALALLSKTTASLLPPALILLRWMRGRSVDGRYLLRLAPLFLMSLVLGLLTVYCEKYRVGALGRPWDFSIGQRLILAGRVPWFYAWKLLWPLNLAFIYPRWELNALSLLQWAPAAAGAAAAGVLWALRGRVGRPLLAGLAFFILMLLPVMGFFNFYPMRFSFVADHFQYLASLGLISVLAAVISRARSANYLLGAVVLVLGALTWRQSHIYRDTDTLWRDTAQKNPAAWLAWSNLAFEDLRRGRMSDAVEHAQAALRLYPDYVEARFNLAVALTSLGDWTEAENQLREIVRIAPNHHPSYNQWGIVASRQGKMNEAIGHFRRAVALKPDDYYCRHNLSQALAAKERPGK